MDIESHFLRIFKNVLGDIFASDATTHILHCLLALWQGIRNLVRIWGCIHNQF